MNRGDDLLGAQQPLHVRRVRLDEKQQVQAVTSCVWAAGEVAVCTTVRGDYLCVPVHRVQTT